MNILRNIQNGDLGKLAESFIGHDTKRQFAALPRCFEKNYDRRCLYTAVELYTCRHRKEGYFFDGIAILGNQSWHRFRDGKFI